MAKPNYSMAKRQRDLAKKAKAEEKRLRKAQAQEGNRPPEGEAEGEPVEIEGTEGAEEGSEPTAEV